MTQETTHGGKREENASTSLKNKDKQRVLIFQGGAALGAYEAGAYSTLYDSLSTQIKQQENLFDIIAGTSVGAINAAIVVSHVVKNRRQHSGWNALKCWEGSAEKLEEFWNDTQTTTGVELMPQFLAGWESWRAISRIGQSWLDIPAQFYSQVNPYFGQWYEKSKEYFDAPASGEAARRYFSIPHLLFYGARNVFWPLAFGIDNIPSSIAIPKMDYRFYNNSPAVPNNLWFRYSNEPLKNILEGKYITSPIATSEEDPRLLVVAVDVQKGDTVAFDSYADLGRKCRICRWQPRDDEKSDEELNREVVKHVFDAHRKNVQQREYKEGDQLRWSVYGSEKSSKYAIFCDQGIEVKHILASASVPVNYDYTELQSIEFQYDQTEISRKDEGEQLFNIKISSKRKFFWDGQYINNTPLRELINEHQRYWIDRIGPEKLKDRFQAEIFDKLQGGQKAYKNADRVPDLGQVYIIDLWPSEEDDISHDHDGQLDRKNDVLFHDKTVYDQKVAELVNDYIQLARELINYIPHDHAIRQRLKSFLKGEGTSKSRSQKKKRKYIDLMIGGFIIDKVVRIERKDDANAISEKWADYSSGTISKLFEQGQKDTRAKIDMV
jgi:NTE family protein